MVGEQLLFRYRSVTEYSIKELKEESVVFSAASTFNDPTDIALTYEPIDYADELVAIKYVGGGLPTDYFDMPKVKSMLSLYFDNQINKMIDNFKKNVIIGCFSIEPHNPVMLSHYAANRSGFVLGYSFKEMNELINNNTIIKCEYFNVNYTGEKLSIHSDAIECLNSFTSLGVDGASLDSKTAQKFFNSQLIKDEKYKKAFYTKDPEWKYENEVRYIGYIDNSNQTHVKIGKCKPELIILGDRISLKDKYLLLSIAREKDIRVLELMLSYRKDQLGLIPIPLTKEMIDSFLHNNNFGYVMHPSLVPSD